MNLDQKMFTLFWSNDIEQILIKKVLSALNHKYLICIMWPYFD